VNGYVVGGWSVTAVILALYTWRLIRRGHLLARALPEEPGNTQLPVAQPLNAQPLCAQPPTGASEVPSATDGAFHPDEDGAGANGRKLGAVSDPSPEVGAWQ
jgi:hypothetical protein